MFENLPIELENMIYKMYFSMNILSEITNRLPIYCTMSDELVTLINKDAFSADPNYFLNENLKRYMVYDYENTESYLCLNCYIIQSQVQTKNYRKGRWCYEKLKFSQLPKKNLLEVQNLEIAL